MSTVDPSRVRDLLLVQSNEREGNRLLAYRRADDGQLAPNGIHPTGGAGDGAAHLPSQGSVVVAGDGARRNPVTDAFPTLSTYTRPACSATLLGAGPVNAVAASESPPSSSTVNTLTSPVPALVTST